MVKTERGFQDVTKDIYLRIARESVANKKEPIAWLENRAKSLAEEGQWETVKAYLVVARELDGTGEDKRSGTEILKERNEILARALQGFARQQEKMFLVYMKLPKLPAGAAADLADESERAEILADYLKEGMVEYFNVDLARLPTVPVKSK